MTLEEIKDEYFKEIGFKSLDDAVMEIAIGMSKIGSASVLENHFTKISERYAQSQTEELKEQNAELVEMLKQTVRALDGNGFPRLRSQIEELLTKYNHLKSKTNEKL